MRVGGSEDESRVDEEAVEEDLSLREKTPIVAMLSFCSRKRVGWMDVGFIVGPRFGGEDGRLVRMTTGTRKVQETSKNWHVRVKLSQLDRHAFTDLGFGELEVKCVSTRTSGIPNPLIAKLIRLQSLRRSQKQQIRMALVEASHPLACCDL